MVIVLNTSPLSGPLACDEGVIDVHICQDNVHGKEWTLKVTGLDGTENWFGQGFKSDQDALDALKDAIAEHGSQYFNQPPPLVIRDP